MTDENRRKPRTQPKTLIGVSAVVFSVCASELVLHEEGALKSLLHGEGDIHRNAVWSDANLMLSGAGNFDIAEIKGQLSIDIGGSGAVKIGSFESTMADIGITGSGAASIERGFIDDLSVYLSGSGGVRFGREARTVAVEFEPGAPDDVIARTGAVKTRRNGAATELRREAS